MRKPPGSVLRVVLVDALSLTGKELCKRLAASALPIGHMRYQDRAERAGTLADYAGEPMVLEAFEAAAAVEEDLVVFCGQPELVQGGLEVLEQGSARVLDLTGALAASRSAEVVVTGVKDPGAGRRLLVSPHPAVVALARLLGPLLETTSLLAADATLLLPVATHGEEGLDELYRQTVEVLSFRPAPVEVLGQRVAFNALPLGGPAARDLESRIRRECRAVLGSGLPPLTVTAVRVPVFLGLGLLLKLEFEDEGDPKALEGLLADGTGLRLQDMASPGELPEDAAEAPIWVFLLEPPDPGRARLWAVMDYLARGAAANAVEVLERLYGA